MATVSICPNFFIVVSWVNVIFIIWLVTIVVAEAWGYIVNHPVSNLHGNANSLKLYNNRNQYLLLCHIDILLVLLEEVLEVECVQHGACSAVNQLEYHIVVCAVTHNVEICYVVAILAVPLELGCVVNLLAEAKVHRVRLVER
jgi:hypothetical protein